MKEFKNHTKRKELEIFETKLALLFLISILLIILFNSFIIKLIGAIIMTYSYSTLLFGSGVYSEDSIKENFENSGKQCYSSCKYCKEDKEELLQYKKEQKAIRFVNIYRQVYTQTKQYFLVLSPK